MLGQQYALMYKVSRLDRKCPEQPTRLKNERSC
jgi:hypothetical protein